MADNKKQKAPEELVRYRVKGKCFVNGSYHDPQGQSDYFIMAPAGLEGASLEVANGKPAEPPADNKPPG